jgi:hypothetical protein
VSAGTGIAAGIALALHPTFREVRIRSIPSWQKFHLACTEARSPLHKLSFVDSTRVHRLSSYLLMSDTSLYEAQIRVRCRIGQKKRRLHSREVYTFPSLEGQRGRRCISLSLVGWRNIKECCSRHSLMFLCSTELFLPERERRGRLRGLLPTSARSELDGLGSRYRCFLWFRLWGRPTACFVPTSTRCL